MKKLLALVLALVMTLSLAVVGSNAAFKDAEKVNASYAEAVDVLAGMKVFQGYPDGSFQPEGSITRAEVAAIVYRLYTGDVADKQASLYATYNKFTDMGGAAWAAGYIGYCANAALVKGYDAKTFGPSDKVTGYQALAMILRAVGYDKNNEFVGADWQLHVAQTAQQLGILKNVKGVDLNAAASRELVAELLFRTAAEVPMVTYTPALGYTNLTAILNGTQNATLGQKNFGLAYTESKSDEWGRPYYVWYDARDTKDGKYVALTSTLYATVKATPVKTYTEAVTECQVAADYGFKATKKFDVYTNGIANKTTPTLNAVNTVSTIGAQGRLTEVYKDRIVMIDTLLAEVTYVGNATFDAAGHLKTPATITLKVYDKGAVRATPAVAYEATTVTETNGSTNYTYAKGDMILLYAVQDANAKVVNTAAKQYVELNGKADSVVGAQSTIWANNAKHVVGGTTYNDNVRFHFDQAANEVTNHTWYFDSYGNLIGASDIISNNYAVLVDIVYNTSTTEFGKATATLMDLAGNKSTVTVSSIDALKDTYDATSPWQNKTFKTAYAGRYGAGFVTDASGVDKALVADNWGSNSFYWGYAMYRVDTLLDGTVALEGFDTKTVVNYIEGAKFVANGSAILDSSSNFVTYVDNNTQYLVRSAKNADGTYTYAPVAGTQAMVGYSSANLFYVDTNGDKIADYVYIKTGVKSGNTEALVYVTTTAYTNKLTDGLGNSTMVANVNGVADQTLTVKAADTAVLTTLAANLNKLCYVEFNADGTVKAATGVKVVNATPITYNVVEKAVYVSNPALSSDGQTLLGNGTGYRINNVKAYIGAADHLDATVLKNNGVWVVYTPSTAAGWENAVSYVYVGEKLTGAGLTGEPAMKAAIAAVTASDFSLTEIKGTEIDDAKVLANVKAQLEAAIDNTNVTVAVAFGTPSGVPAAGAKANVTFYYSLYVAGATTTHVGQTKVVSVDHLYTEAELKTAVETAIAGQAKMSVNSTYSAFATNATTAVNAINGVSDFTITSAAPSNYAAAHENTFTLTYSLTYNGTVKTGSYYVTVVA